MKFHTKAQWYSGTGWLIDKQTAITAAHNFYPKAIDTSNQSPAVASTSYAEVVIVTIGSSGTQNTDADKAEIRRGKSVAVHLDYHS